MGLESALQGWDDYETGISFSCSKEKEKSNAMFKLLRTRFFWLFRLPFHYNLMVLDRKANGSICLGPIGLRSNHIE